MVQLLIFHGTKLPQHRHSNEATRQFPHGKELVDDFQHSCVRSDEIGASGGTCTHTLPADNGLLFYSATEAEMVGSAGNAPVVGSGSFEDTAYTVRQPDHFPKIGSGGESCAHGG